MSLYILIPDNKGIFFLFQVFYFKAYEEYVANYPVAVETIKKYQRNEETKHLLEVSVSGNNFSIYLKLQEKK